MTAERKKAPFSSTAATLKWARGVWGDEAVTNASYWLSFGAHDENGDEGSGRRRGGPPGGVRKDLYGFIDVVALDGLPGLLALQACGGDVGKHKRKLDGEVTFEVKPEKALKAEIDAAKLAGRVRRWLAAGNRLLLVAWRDVWVTTSERHKLRKKAPRFLEARLSYYCKGCYRECVNGSAYHGPEGRTCGPVEERVAWTEHDEWPPRADF